MGLLIVTGLLLDLRLLHQSERSPMVYEFCGWLCSNINGTSGSSFADKKQRSTVGKWAEAIVTALLRVGAKIVILEMLSVSRNRDTERQRFRRNTLPGAI